MSIRDRVVAELEHLDFNKDGKLDKRDVRVLINRELGETVESEIAVLWAGSCLVVGLILGSVFF